ncbi:ArsR family transcriptional regulator [Flavobacterium sp. CBA20B-1]|uniref:ArsR family transcriptional regulator n=1 Tax=Flavobacterium sp. CBA20B-1 TaxID=2918454 RepID=UPI00234B9D1B|nr:ArsR family transcriptional regulator [Flavobacterium sp. CBA20B-1]WCM42238.1 ArsR family transcriptional regulator [Flavobacterium sp. CBA20B-1]
MFINKKRVPLLLIWAMYMLESLITSKTRVKLLVKFFVTSANSGHLRGLASEFNESTNAIRKELNHLSEAGYLQKKEVSNKIAYNANTKHPMFQLLQQVVHKYLGLDAIVEQILERMGDVKQIELIGDYAKGIDSGTIEINIVGTDINTEYTENIIPKIKDIAHRSICFYYNKPLSKDGIVLFGGEGQISANDSSYKSSIG